MIPAGLTSVTATYDGGGNFAGSTTAVRLGILPAAPSFSVHSASISSGTSTLTLAGTLGSGSVFPPAGELVQVSLDGQTQTVPIGFAGAFSATFSTGTLGVAGSPYTVTYSYGGDFDFGPATDSSTSVTVTPATVPAPGVYVFGTVLYVIGGANTNDAVTVSPAVPGGNGSTGLVLSGILDGAALSQTLKQAFSSIEILGGNGNNVFTLTRGVTLPATIIGGDGNNVITLGNGNHVIHLGSGDDQVTAGKGKNTVVLGAGRDSVSVGRGKNVIRAGNRHDTIKLHGGQNTVTLGATRVALEVRGGHPHGSPLGVARRR